MTNVHGSTTASPLAPRPLPRERRDPWPEFLRTFAWVGLNTFGGPVAQIGFMHDLAVEKRKWLTDGEFVHLLNFANILPGPEALELAIHLGSLRRGMFGGVIAGLFFIAPGFVALTGLAWLYVEHGDLGLVRGALDGIRPVAVALIAAAVMRLASRSLSGIASHALRRESPAERREPAVTSPRALAAGAHRTLRYAAYVRAATVGWSLSARTRRASLSS